MRTREIVGSEEGAGMRVGVAVAEFNQAITEKLLAGALQQLEGLGVPEVDVLRVPGALELGVAIRHLIEAGCQTVVAIGAVIKGETDHYEHVAREASAAITAIALESGVPVTNAVLTVTELSHALDRCGPGSGNKGAEAALAAVRTRTALDALTSAES